MGLAEARVLHAEVVADQLEYALEHGTDHELAMALCVYLRNGVLQHSAAAGDAVSITAAQAIAGNLGFGLAQMIRRTA